ncbi:MAG: 30S ribosomal protein S8 [Bdellovibrionales bacterium]
MDTVGDFLTRIRNAGMARHEKVDVPSSNLRKGIAAILKEHGYIKNFREAKDSKQGIMRVYLNYDAKGKTAIDTISRVSTPGKRVYVKATEIPEVRSGFGISVVSTSKGILSGKQAAQQNLGGEYLLKVW